MLFQNKLFLLGKTSGLVSVLLYLAAAAASYYGTPRTVFLVLGIYYVGLLLSTDVVNPANRAAEEYTGFWEKFAKVSMAFALLLALSQGMTSAQIFESGTQNDVTYGSFILLVLGPIIAWAWNKGKLPTGFSNIAGCLLLGWYFAAVGVAYIQPSAPWLWPNTLEIMTLVALGAGTLLWIGGANWKRGFIGSMATYFVGGLALSSLLEVFMRENEIPLSKYLWLGMLGLLPILFLYGAVDYFIFQRRRPQVTYKKENQ